MTRNEENKLIAEKCERLDVKWDEDQGVYVRFSHWLTPFRGSPDPCFIPINDYFTDIAACVRAAEAWRSKQPDQTTARVELAMLHSSHIEWVANVIDASSIEGFVVYKGFRPTASAALAAALVEAVK